jgi:gliding motility-associated protein GldM
MSLPKEPRQKMINMMYLVLTALLALNVSAEILNAFKTVNNSLQKTNTVVNNSTQTIMKSLADNITNPQDASTAAKAAIWKPKAEQVVNYTAGVYNYIQSLKDQITKAAGGDPATGKELTRDDNMDIPTRLLIDQGAGKKLLEMLTQYKSDILTKIDPLVSTQFAISLPINLEKPNNKSGSWESAYFHMVPTIASITMLSKFQNDLRTTENKVVAFCHEQVGKVVVKFDTYAAIVGQSSKYLMPGQNLEITAGVGAFSKTAKPNVNIGGANIPVGDEGTATQSIAGGGVGNHSIPVTIVYTDQDGKQQTIKKDIEYTVGQSNASIALPKMNVLYIGYPNPVFVAAGGAGAEQLSVSMSGGGGSISGGKGEYIARVTSQTDNCIITVSANGRVLGQQSFRVRALPDPVATVGGEPSGANVSAQAFKAQAGVGAYVKDFPLDLKYSVTSFSIVADTEDGDIATADCTGNAWSPKARQIINGLKSGQLITIENIYCVGEDGRRRKLPALLYNMR